eukprot:gene32477-43393_t
MLHAPLLPTLFRLATPNVLGLFATTIVIGYDGYILGRVGADALAGIALVFPLSMLMLQMSAGGIGGATTAAVARALGAGRGEDASRLAQQAMFIAVALAALFMLAMLGFGRGIFGGMGGRGAALEAALAYSNVLFSGAVIIWFTNVLAAVVRGAGNMLLPSVLLLGTALLHLALCPLLVFGWGAVPGLGVAGAAVSTLVVNALSALVMVAHLLRRDGAVHLQRSPWRLRLPLLRAKGINFRNSPSLFPTFTMANASGMATGHYLGDTGTFSNSIYTGRPTPVQNGSVIPFIEHDQVLGDLDEQFNGDYLNEETLLKAARKAGFSTAAIGKVGPTLVFDHTERTGTQSIILDDQTQAVAMWQALLEGGLYVNMARPPATPAGTYLLRCSLCAEHSAEQIQTVLGMFRAAGQALGVIA